MSCGRSVAFDVNVCPYCGHDYRLKAKGQAHEPISSGLRALLYVVSLLVWLAGIIIGIVYMAKDDPEYRRVGKICIILGIVSMVVGFALSALLYVMVLGFGSAGPNVTPTSSLDIATTADDVRFSFRTVNTEMPWSDLAIMLDDGTDMVSWHPVSSDLVGDIAETAEYGPRTLSGMGVYLTVTDYAGDGDADQMDYFVLSPMSSFTTSVSYTVTVIWEPSSQEVCAKIFTL